jgi:hypothetical protein
MKRSVLTCLCCLPLLLGACGSSPTAGPASGATAAPATSSPPTLTATPAADPDQAPEASLPAFACQGDQAGGGAAGGTITAVRTASHAGFDRFVLQFAAGVPGYHVDRQAGARFTRDGRGQGSAGILVRLFPASVAPSFAGPPDLVGLPALREARVVGDYEGYVSWGLGLAQQPCMRVFTMSNPARLVVDVRR